MTALSDLLAGAKGDRSVDDLIVAAEKRLGRQIHRTFRATIYRALDGDHAKSPREETLQLLAHVFELDIRDLRTAAKMPAGELGPYVPTSEASRLDREQRRALDNLIKSIVKTVGGQGAGSASATKRPGADPATPKLQSLPTAASKVKSEPSVSKRRRRQDEAAEANQDKGGMDPA